MPRMFNAFHEKGPKMLEKINNAVMAVLAVVYLSMFIKMLTTVLR